jgi:hypothetical protein
VDVVELLEECGNAWKCDGSAMEERRKSDGSAMEERWKCDGRAMEVRWKSDGSAMEEHQSDDKMTAAFLLRIFQVVSSSCSRMFEDVREWKTHVLGGIFGNSCFCALDSRRGCHISNGLRLQLCNTFI